jgi:hypothetical protein
MGRIRILAAGVVAAAVIAPIASSGAARSDRLRIPGLDGATLTIERHEIAPPTDAFDGAHVFALSDVRAPGSWGRLAVVDGHASGVFVSDEGTWWLADGSDGMLRAVPDADAVARIPLAERRIEDDEMAAVSCDSLNWTPVLASPTHLVSGSPARTFNVAFAYDAAYQARYGASWNATLLATISTIDALMFRDASIHVVANRIDQVPAGLAADTTTETLVKLQDHYNATYGGQLAETVFLFSGRDFTGPAGQVNCVGSAGRTNVSYGVASVAGGDHAYPGGLMLLPDPGIKIGAHELGHTLSAHHHYANCAEAAPFYNPVHTTDACTVLINDWGLIGLRFSSLERLTMAGWADAYDI